MQCEILKIDVIKVSRNEDKMMILSLEDYPHLGRFGLSFRYNNELNHIAMTRIGCDLASTISAGGTVEYNFYIKQWEILRYLHGGAVQEEIWSLNKIRDKLNIYWNRDHWLIILQSYCKSFYSLSHLGDCLDLLSSDLCIRFLSELYYKSEK